MFLELRLKCLVLYSIKIKSINDSNKMIHKITSVLNFFLNV